MNFKEELEQRTREAEEIIPIYVFCDLIELYHSTGICQYISAKKRRNFSPEKPLRFIFFIFQILLM